MKTVIFILTVLLVAGCGNTREDVELQGAAERIPEPERDLRLVSETSAASDASGAPHRTCSAVDFMKLMSSDLRKDFFSQIDSVRRAQSPDYDQDAGIFVDLTPRLLDRFLRDISRDSLVQGNSFEREYHFNIAPSGFTDPATCRDKISITFDETYCGFRLVIYNTFLAEPGWCTESSVVYGFEIEEGRIVEFGRTVAG